MRGRWAFTLEKGVTWTVTLFDRDGVPRGPYLVVGWSSGEGYDGMPDCSCCVNVPSGERVEVDGFHCCGGTGQTPVMMVPAMIREPDSHVCFLLVPIFAG